MSFKIKKEMLKGEFKKVTRRYTEEVQLARRGGELYRVFRE